MAPDCAIGPWGELASLPRQSSGHVFVNGLEVPAINADACFAWRTRDGRAHRLLWWEFARVVPSYVVPTGADGQPDDSTYGQVRGALDEFARTAGPSGARSDVLDGLASTIGWTCCLTTMFLALARRPRRGTRWFWFWVSGMPLGIGVLWFIRAELLGRPRPDGRRTSGWWGLLANFLVSSVAHTVVGLALL